MAHTHVLEFQKRGLPDIHMLVFLDKESKLKSADDVNKIISAEIPDMEEYPRLY